MNNDEQNWQDKIRLRHTTPLDQVMNNVVNMIDLLRGSKRDTIDKTDALNFLRDQHKLLLQAHWPEIERD